MKEPIKFKCPRCGCEANAYSQVMAGCVNCGVLPYTDIPQEVKSQLTKRPANGGGTVPQAGTPIDEEAFERNSHGTTVRR